MTKDENVQWYAVRAIFSHSVDPRDDALYEERILLYRASDAIDAINAAQEDVACYLRLNPEFRKLGPLRAFVLSSNDEDLHRAEVWSQVLKGTGNADEFYRDRYASFELKE